MATILVVKRARDLCTSCKCATKKGYCAVTTQRILRMHVGMDPPCFGGICGLERGEEEEKLKISPVRFTCARGREEGSRGGQVSSIEQDTHNEGGAYGIGQTALRGQSGVRSALRAECQRGRRRRRRQIKIVSGLIKERIGGKQRGWPGEKSCEWM